MFEYIFGFWAYKLYSTIYSEIVIYFYKIKKEIRTKQAFDAPSNFNIIYSFDSLNRDELENIRNKNRYV